MDIRRTFAKYVTLNILGMLGLSCYILADTFFVARGIGADGLTALNLAIPVYSFIHGVGLMIGMGGATRFAISKSISIFTQSLFLALFLSLMFLTIGLFLPGQIAGALGGNSSTYQMTKIYLQVILCFAPMFILNNVIICFVRNDSNPKLSMIAMLTGSFSNIVLDYLFVFPLEMGIFGAALATGIAPVISLSILSIHLLQKKNTFRPNREKPYVKSFLDISALGVSSLITEFSSGIVIIVFNGIMLRLEGNLGVAAYGIIANISLVIISIFTGIAQGIQPIISRCYSVKNTWEIKKVMKYGFITAITLALLAYGTTFIFAKPIVSLFNKEQNLQLANIAINGLRIYFLAFIFVGVNILTATYFSAVDKAVNAFVISLLRGFFIIIPMSFILSAIFGITGVWLTLTVTEVIVCIFAMIMLRRSNKIFSHRTENI